MTHEKRIKNWQKREGNAKRRLREFNAIVRAVKLNKERFIQRLQRNVRQPRSKIGKANGCLLYKSTRDRNGYPRITFYLPDHGSFSILACRVFVILRNAEPIPLGKDAAHIFPCRDRRCIRHVEAQPYQINARTDGPHAGIPF